MNQPKIVVLGAGYAGLFSALRLAKKTHAQITLVNAAPVFVERVRLHQQAAGQNIVQHSIAKIIEGTKIDFVQGFVTSLDPQSRTVKVKLGESEQNLKYDNLVYALGSTIDRDSVEGVRDYADVTTPDQIERLHHKLAALPSGTKLVICGGGLTGIESSTEFAEAYPHLAVTLVTKDEFGANLSQSGRKHVRKVFERLGITLQDNTVVQRIAAAEIVTDKGNLPYDSVIWTGAFSIPTLAAEAGLLTNARGQIVVDNYLRSVSYPEIYGLGDAAYPTEVQPNLRMACATALPMALRGSDNLAAKLAEQPEKPLHFKYYFRCISLGRHNGLIQMVKGDDSPREMVITGGFAAFLKEQVCRGALAFIRMQKHSSGKTQTSVAKSDPVQVV